MAASHQINFYHFFQPKQFFSAERPDHIVKPSEFFTVFDPE